MIAVETPLVLGSRSPRRSDILEGLGVPVLVYPADVDESQLPEEPPANYVRRVTEAKLEAVGSQLRRDPRFAGRAIGGVLTADTTVVVDTDILGKPDDVDDALRLLGRIAGRCHRVLTCYAIATPLEPARPAVCRIVESRVYMRAANEDELRRYAQTGEGLDKAGAYAVQGIGAFLIERIDGSYSNVVGLPACEVVLDLQRLGLLGDFPAGGSAAGQAP
jgi:septum formation protein